VALAGAPNTLDDPQVTVRRRGVLAVDGYLRSLYLCWYSAISGALPSCRGDVLELGSGGGFLKELLPQLRTSDVMPLPGIEMQVDAREIPFPDNSLRAIVGTNVLHHIPQIEKFLAEAERTLVDGGRLVFIEPWPTPLSRLVYRHLHHEPFDEGRDWTISPGGPLTSANGALPWIVFERDRARLSQEFPALRVISRTTMMPLSYILSGGIERAWPLPSWLFRMIRLSERAADSQGLFALIIIERGSRHG
jgi:SAM-dependent methyltransferase